jgi:hypothetical protein
VAGASSIFRQPALALSPVIQVGASPAILLAATLVSKQATLLMGNGNNAAEGTMSTRSRATKRCRDAPPGIRHARDLAATEGVER